MTLAAKRRVVPIIAVAVAMIATMAAIAWLLRSSEPSPKTPPAYNLDPADAGWFLLDPDFSDPDTLTGFTLAAGYLDGSKTLDLTQSVEPAMAGSALRGSMPFARPPVGSTLLYGYTTAAKSEVHLVSLTSGDDRLGWRSPEIVSDAVIDPRDGYSVIMLMIDRTTRLPLGVFRLDPDVGEVERIADEWRIWGMSSAKSITNRLFVDATGRITIWSCADSRCSAFVEGSAGTMLELDLGALARAEPLGTVRDGLVLRSPCGRQGCAIWVASVAGRRAIATTCELAVVDAVTRDERLFVETGGSGSCGGAYQIQTVELNSLRQYAAYADDTERRLVVSDAGQGVTLPAGWFALAVDGSLSTGSSATAPMLAVRAADLQSLEVAVAP